MMRTARSIDASSMVRDQGVRKIDVKEYLLAHTQPEILIFGKEHHSNSAAV
jgi:hypothetical protein